MWWVKACATILVYTWGWKAGPHAYWTGTLPIELHSQQAGSFSIHLIKDSLSPDLVPHNHSLFPFTPEHYSVDQIPFKNKTKGHCLNLVFLIISGDISLSIHVNIFNDFFQLPRIVFYKYIYHLSGHEHIAFLYLLNSSIYPLLDTGKIVISQA